MKNLTWQNPEQLFVAQELINKVKSKCCGIKVINKEETNTPLTQIAVTQIKAEESIEEHLHPTMEEFFLFQKGDAIITIDKEQLACSNGDFISIPANTLHSLKAITDIEIITIGCAIF